MPKERASNVFFNEKLSDVRLKWFPFNNLYLKLCIKEGFKIRLLIL
jgi:hypothetical protein